MVPAQALAPGAVEVVERPGDPLVAAVATGVARGPRAVGLETPAAVAARESVAVAPPVVPVAALQGALVRLPG